MKIFRDLKNFTIKTKKEKKKNGKTKNSQKKKLKTNKKF